MTRSGESPDPAPPLSPGDSSRLRRILALALPIIGGMLSQNTLNLVDTLMVGRIGAAALAAVGIASFANFLSYAFVTGVSAGVQATAARRIGEGRAGEAAVPLNGGLAMVAVTAVPLSIALILLVPHLFPLLESDPKVVALGSPYLRVRLVAMVAVGCNFAFRGYFNGVGQSRLYLRTLLVMHAANVLLDYALIFGHFGAPRLGVTGAGIASAIATYVGTGYYFSLGLRHARRAGFLSRMPSRRDLRTVIRLSIPSGIERTFFAAGLTTLFTIVGLVGTTALAAANVLQNIALVAVLPGLGLGIAAASLVGQALGRGDVRDARRWGWEVARIGMVVMAVLGLPMMIAPALVLSPFFRDPSVMAVAELPLRLVGAAISVDALGMVLVNGLMGAGATRIAMMVSVGAQWGLFLPAAYLVGPVLGFGLTGIWIAQISYRALVALAAVLLWRSEVWTRIKV